MIRLPKLYADQDHAAFIARGNEWRERDTVFGKVLLGAHSNVFRDARAFPCLYGLTGDSNEIPFTDVVERLTGFRAITDAQFSVASCREWWVPWNAPWVALRPIMQIGYGRTLYYRRDLIAVSLPRWRCAACGSKPGRREPRDKPSPVCPSQCDRFLASTAFALLSTKEQRVWWEHQTAAVCSQACHVHVERRYRRITLALREKRLWIRQGKQLLSEIQEKLPENSRRTAHRRVSASPRTESRPLTISAT